LPEPGTPGPGEWGGPGGWPARFGELLLACRRSAGLTQEDLAARSGVSVRAISDLERGRATSPQRRSAELLGEALGLSGAALTDFLGVARSGRPRRAPAAVTPPRGSAGPIGAGCTLPIDAADFTARHEELGRFRAVAGRAAGPDAGPAQVVAISGQPGVGKTALAIHASHLLAAAFPDG
jgi:transcriptional regulator with XRE-family HTH domain